MRSLGALLALLFLVTACGAGEHQSPRVTLWAENHHPHPSQSPSWQWWYCVKVTTPVASRILVQIVSGRTPVEGVGEIWLKKGYNRRCADIGGEANVLDSLPRGKKLVLQAAVRADGVTVEQNWPIVVPAGRIYSVPEVTAAFASQGITLKGETPPGWPSDVAALWARHEVFVEVLFREPGVWGGPGLAHVSSGVSAHTNFTARANIEVWSSPAVRTAVQHALARFRAR